ncbi:MAG: stalk domain-containing protein [Clostridia bacterium]|nr:stalk domain-containing protein [Clostridia bacterium]
MIIFNKIQAIKINSIELFLKFLICTAAAVFIQSAFVFGADYVEFGSYPQSHINPTSEIENAAYNSDNDAQIGNDKYRRVLNSDGEYEYFKYEPLYWEIINTDSKTILLSKNIIDSQPYDQQEDKYVDFNGGLKYADAVTWEESSIRSWLNSQFYNIAFSSDEKAKINKISYDNVQLLGVSQAENMDTSSLKKNCSDYALAMGVKTYDGIYSDNNGSWLLKDTSPIVDSNICHVLYDGTINKGITVLVSDEGYGIVPCISLSSMDGLSNYTEDKENEIYVYKPNGETSKITEAQRESYLNSGWYETLDEAKIHLGDMINENFKKLSVYELYSPFVSNYASGSQGIINLSCEDMNLSKTDIIKFLYPLVNEALTGQPSDYMEISVKFYYDASYGTSLNDFAKNFADSALDAIYTCWTNWGGIINTANSTYGYDGNTFNITVHLTINCAANDYYNKLNEIASAAKIYSNTPLGQIQYIRNYLAENAHYEPKLISNSPSSILLHGEGVCGNYANAVKDLCFMLDIPCFVISNSEQNHAKNCLFIEGSWYKLDTTGISDSSYSINGEYREFTQGKFTDSEAKADNVSFLDDDIGSSSLKYGANKGDDVNKEDFAIIKNLFEKGFTASDFKNRFTIPQKEADNSVRVVVNGTTILAQKEAYIENGRILIPMRIIFENLGAEVSWDAETKTVTAIKDNTTVKLQVGSNIMYINNSPVTMDTTVKTVNGETLVSVRAVSEAFNAETNWDSITRTVNILG